MQQLDTIAAIITPPGEGGISAIRLSGSRAVEIAEKIFTPKQPGKTLAGMKGYTAAFGTLHQNGTPLDEGIALVFRAPKSYTGEDCVELSVHGGSFLIRQVLRDALQAGARAAEGGEFTKRAYQNGKLDLAEAEAVMGLIHATGSQALNIATRNKSGAVSKKINQIIAGLLDLAAQIAVFSDYPEDDTLHLSQSDFAAGLQTALQQLTLLIKHYDSGKYLTGGVNTVIVGSPNAGKSTLMNLLSGTERSIVTNIAGTTRDVIEQTVQLGNFTLHLADTAGIHKTGDAVEQLGIQAALNRLSTAELCLAVFDTARPLTADDKALLQQVSKKNTLLVLNKTDLPAAESRAALKQSGLSFVEISALNGTGRQELEQAIAKLLGTAALDPNAEILGSERQYALVCRAKNAVDEALTALQSGVTLDAVGVLTDEALAALYELNGKKVTVEVANQVFKNFCVGK